MKRLLLVCLILLSGSVGAQCNSCSCLRNCYVLGGWIKLCLYLSGEAGISWVQLPERCPGCGEIFFDKTRFSWGIVSGFQFPVCREKILFGIDGGYHENGQANLDFGQCRLFRWRSQDVSVSATFNYHLSRKIDFLCKLGGAHIREKMGRRFAPGGNSSAEQWAPVFQTGFSFRFLNCLSAALSYRGIYCDHKKEAIHFGKGFALNRCSTVHSFYGGLNLIF